MRQLQKVICYKAKTTLNLKEMFHKEERPEKEEINSKLPKYTPPEPPPKKESTVKKYRVLFDDGNDMVINQENCDALIFFLKDHYDSCDVFLGNNIYLKSLDGIKSIYPI